MKFDLKNEGTFFSFPGESGGVSVRVCAGKDIDLINKRTKKVRFEYKKGQRFEITEVDNELYQKLLWDFCIVSWIDVQDAEGNALPCTPENKMLLMNSSNAFATFVTDALEKVDLAQQKVLEDESKN